MTSLRPIEMLSPSQSQRFLAEQLMSHSVPVQRTSWQGIEAPSPAFETSNALAAFDVPDSICKWQQACDPDLPWAEDHFQERVCGQPLNPPPSSAQWPWYSEEQRKRFLKGERFDHTYPERYWPKRAGVEDHNRGILR
jgi:hypothetical protein